MQIKVIPITATNSAELKSKAPTFQEHHPQQCEALLLPKQVIFSLNLKREGLIPNIEMDKPWIKL